MIEKIKEIESRFKQLEDDMSRPEINQDQKVFQKYSKEHSHLEPIIQTYRKYQSTGEEIKGNQSLLDDPDHEIRKLAHDEIESLKSELSQLEMELKVLLLPQDPNDEKNIILEIRAGTGGEEAGLFAADLFRMYLKYAELSGWKSDILSQHNTGIGGFKERLSY